MSQSTDQYNLERYANKVALVTGASAGIGKYIALDLALKANMTVIACARRKEKIEEYWKEIQASKSSATDQGKIIAYKCDVCDEQEIVKMFEWVKQNYGELSVLINNAGVAGYGSVLDGTTEVWRKIFDTNVFGLAICTREGFKIMHETENKYPECPGSIINISSVLGIQLYRNLSFVHMYSASKFAVTAITGGTRAEVIDKGSKIRVGQICPGYVATDIVEANFGKEMLPKIDESFPNPMQPEDISETVLHFLSLNNRCCPCNIYLERSCSFN